MSDWPKQRLGEILSLEYGKALPEANRDGSGTCVVAGSNGPQGVHSQSLLRAPAIVIGRKGSAGQVNWFEQDVWPIDTTYFVVPKAALNYRWLYYCLRSVGLSELTTATGVPGLNRNDVYQLDVVVPPLPEQERFVRILDEADALRRLRQEADGRTGNIVRPLFEDYFDDPIANPKAWPVVAVSRFVSRFQAGRSVAPAGEEQVNSKYRILKVSAVTWGRFAPEESKPVPDTYSPPREQFVSPGDILFSRANTTELVGATVLVDSTPCNLLLPDKLWRFVWNDPAAVAPRFVLALFQHPSIRRELGVRATGTGGSMKNISMDKVLSMTVPFPPISLQRAFAARVAEIRELQSAQAASRKRIDDLFQSLLHRAFQGEL